MHNFVSTKWKVDSFKFAKKKNEVREKLSAIDKYNI